MKGVERFDVKVDGDHMMVGNTVDLEIRDERRIVDICEVLRWRLKIGGGHQCGD